MTSTASRLSPSSQRIEATSDPHESGCLPRRAEIATDPRAAHRDSMRCDDAQDCKAAEPSRDLGRLAAPAKLHAHRHASHAIDRLPLGLRRELRTDHAGETGAVMIYRGILAVARDPALRDFAVHHLATEQRHLSAIEQVVPPRWRSRLLPLWRVSGWLTGALSACLGPGAVYATIQAVETFVDHHYAAQVRAIDALLCAPAGTAPDDDARADVPSLRALLEQCRLDEVAHRDDAGARCDGRPSAVVALWRALIAGGSAAAVGVCRRL